MGFKTKKLASYIREDRLRRVQSYVEKYGPKVTKVSLDRQGRTALHLACRHSSIYCFGYLLKHNPNLMKTDHDGNLCLHWGLDAAKKGERYAYTDIVLPLLKLCPASADVANKAGKTARGILSDLGLSFEDNCGRRGSFEPSEASSDDDYTDDDEIAMHAWEAKLRCEMQEEYDEAWGQYEQDYAEEFDCSQPESYENWTNRMSSEYNNKHNGYNHHHIPKENNKSKTDAKFGWTSADQERFEQESQREEEARLKRRKCDERYTRLQQKLHFVMKYSKLFNAKNSAVVRLKDLPWIDFASSAEEILAVLLVDVDTSDHVAVKKCLREQQVHWHPDKFLQKCGNRLADDDRADIIAAVNQFSQIINAALNSIAST